MESESNIIRIVRLEDKVDVHEKRIVSLDSRVGQLHSDLSKLISLTSNIRWWLMGVGSFYIGQEVGILLFIQKFLGL